MNVVESVTHWKRTRHRYSKGSTYVIVRRDIILSAIKIAFGYPIRSNSSWISFKRVMIHLHAATKAENGRWNWANDNSIGRVWRRLLLAMFATVILAKGAKPQEIGIIDSCKHWLSRNSAGRTSQWTWSMGCQCRTVITLPARLLTEWPKNGTTLPALPAMKELPTKEWSKFLCNTSWRLMDCQARSLRIEVISLYPWFGKSFANACKLKPTYL